MTQTLIQDAFWATVKGTLQSLFPHDVYNTWFASLECTAEDDEYVTLSAPNPFAAIWVQDNYQDLLERHLSETAGRPMRVRIEVSETDSDSSAADERLREARPDSSRIERVSRSRAHPPAQKLNINPRNTFDNFVVGAGNQLAHAASIAVANAPALAYNPLFLYGDTGLGKTHLMHAIAHQVSKSNPDARIAYMSAETFTNEFIEAIKAQTVPRFRQRYRQVDILLIDDIQFLSGKESCQDQFFHTFNELFESQKQLVLSSDRPASEIARLESRLVSRFQWGLVVDIQAPDFETRVAILTNKARSMKLNIPDSVIQFLAERVSRNVRRMEGALTRVAGYMSLMNRPVDIPVVEKLLQDILQEEARNQITITKIQQKVADYHKIRLEDMSSRRRPSNIAFPRQIAMYLSRMLTSHSLQEIGQAFGGRDHGTVIHACKTVENMMDQDASVKRTVDYLQTQLVSQR